MCDINEVNDSLTAFKKVTEERHSQLEGMITEVQEKDREEHQIIREKQDRLTNKVSELVDSIVEYKIETSEKLGAITGKLGITEGKADIAVSQSKTEKQINTILKWAIGIAVLIGLSMLGVMTNNSINSRRQLEAEAKQNKADFIEKTKAYKAMIEMNTKFESFSGRALFDTINSHWKQTRQFYKEEYLPQKKAFLKEYKKEIHPTSLLSQRNCILLQDHEKRIMKLERKEN